MHVRPPEPGGLRAVTYNVHDLRDDRDATAHVLRTLRADVVCLQEVPRRLAAAGRLARLAREVGLQVAAAGRGSGGTAVLAHPRLDVVSARVERLPVAGATTRTRGVAIAALRLPDGTRVSVASVHLPLLAGERMVHARLVLHTLADVGRSPYILGGDLNEPPDGPSWAVLGEQLDDVAPGGAGTFPSSGARRRIDALLVSGGVRVEDARVAGELDGLSEAVLARASDHLPVLADLVVQCGR
ncbi:endonuclease/exonuclease/phosphatase family protein [Angustibacter sp. McL0619]|uniref:endonuclease/exonuclease/phosphatase family protein n=1 Tax=Angustibacter sp. McL0619 TaxID=3415676 RepID=UPI003CE8B23F